MGVDCHDRPGYGFVKSLKDSEEEDEMRNQVKPKITEAI